MKNGKLKAESKAMKSFGWFANILLAAFFTLGPRPPAFGPSFLLGQSGTGGSGNSMACSGGEPYYCAPDDRAIRPVTWIAPPAFNQPIVLPDFGERAVRATGPNTNPAIPNQQYTANSGDYYSQWSAYDPLMCGGTGGYRFAVLQQATGPLLFDFCPSTFTTTEEGQLSFPQTGAQFSHLDPAAIYGTSGSILVMYCSAEATSNSTVYPLCANKAGTYTHLYDFSTCPNLPEPLDSHYEDAPTEDATDRYFADVFADAQNSWGYIVWWDKQTDTCKWLDSGRFEYGGTGVAPTPVSVGTPYQNFLSQAPTVTPEYTSGTMAAHTYNVGVTYSSYIWQYGVGESPLSAIKQVTLTSTGGFVVTPPNCNDSFWCTDGGITQYQPEYSVYACDATLTPGCTPTLQMYIQFTPVGDGTTKSFTVSAPTAAAFPSLVDATDAIDGEGIWNFTNLPWTYWGGATYFNYFGGGAVSYTWTASTITENFSVAPAAGNTVWLRWSSSNNPNNPLGSPVSTTIATLVTDGPTAPTVATTAGGGGGIHTVALNMAGNRVFFEMHGGAYDWNALFWNPATGAVVGCNNTQSCSGHLAFGFNKFIGQNNWISYSSAPIYGGFNYGIAGLDTPDTYTTMLTGPPAGQAVMNNSTQHLSWNNNLNGEDNEPACQGGSPLGGLDLNVLAPLDSEMFCFSPVTGHIWRFFHTRSSGAPYVGGAYQPTGPAFWHLTLGAQSQDGKYALLSDDWFGSLGWTELGNWTANQGYSQGSEVVDGKGNLEVESASGSCTSGASVSWPSTFNAVTTDGTCTWHLLGIAGQMFAGLNWSANGGYVGGVYIIDSNFNLEYEMTPDCYSGAATPAWNSTTGGLVQDNSCTWQNKGPSGLTFIPNAPTTRTDVWVVEMK